MLSIAIFLYSGLLILMLLYLQKTNEDIEVILLGNKCDKETERVIPKNHGEKVKRWIRNAFFLTFQNLILYFQKYGVKTEFKIL